MLTHPRKYPSTKHWPWSQTVHRDDSVLPDPAVFLNKDVIITEKLDGGNTCLWNGEVYARSTTAPSHAGWMGMVRKHHAWKTHEYDVQFYGEDLFGIHSIEYDPMKQEETYRLFATRFTCDRFGQDNDVFHEWGTVEWFANKLEVPTVPVLYRGSFSSVEDITSWFETHLTQPSSIGGEREGFVIRSEECFHATDFSQNVAKYVRANHVQTDEHWTRNWKTCRLK